MATSTEKVLYLLQLRDKFSAQMKTANRAMNQADSDAKRFSNTLKTMLPLLSVGAAVAGIKKTVALYEKEEQAIAQVKQGLISTNGQVGRTFQQLTAQADALQKKTLFGNEQTLQGVTAQLLTFTNVSGTAFDRAQKAVLDLTARLDGPRAGMEALRGKSIQVGKALNDPITGMSALARSGITFTKSQKKTVKQLVKTNQLAKAQGIILDELEKQYGGSAEAAAKTATGQLIQFENRMGDIGETIGGALIPHLLMLAKKFESITSFVQDNAETFKFLAKIVIRVGAAYIAYRATIVATQKATLIWNAIQKGSVIMNALLTGGLKKARVAMRLFNITTKANPIGLIVAALVIAVPLMLKFFESTKKLSAGMQALANVSKRANKLHEEQAAKLRVLKLTLDQGNLSQSKRNNIIKEINKTYGEYLPKLLTEKSTDEEIAVALKSVNDQLLRKARIQAGKDIILENAKEAIKLERLLRDEKALTEKASEGFMTQAQLLSASMSFSKERVLKQLVDKERLSAKDRL